MVFLRRFLRPRQAVAAVACAVVTPALISISSTRNESSGPDTQEKSSKLAAPTSSIDYVGVFLSNKSAQQLKTEYPTPLSAVSAGNERTSSPLCAVLKYNPSEKESEAFAALLGSTAKLHVLAIIEDDMTQAAVVKVSSVTGDPIEYEDGAEQAHVLLASAMGMDGFNHGQANVLLERLRASKQLEGLLEKATEQKEQSAIEWSGEVPAFASQHFPLYSPFPATQVSIRALPTPLELDGTVCLSSTYDHKNGVCTSVPTKPECGFCKFMKAGPCGEEFTAWEACLDRCKANGDDFIEHCGPQTIALRDCVDANPEYYHVLNETDSDTSEAEASANSDIATATN